MHLGAKPSTFQNAYHLRNNRTPAEILLWEYLRDSKMEGVKFRQQHPFNKFAADFYAHELKFIIEVDGDVHLEPDQIIVDAERTKAIIEFNLELQRFTNNEVINYTHEVVRRIRDRVIELKEGKKK